VTCHIGKARGSAPMLEAGTPPKAESLKSTP